MNDNAGNLTSDPEYLTDFSEGENEADGRTNTLFRKLEETVIPTGKIRGRGRGRGRPSKKIGSKVNNDTFCNTERNDMPANDDSLKVLITNLSAQTAAQTAQIGINHSELSSRLDVILKRLDSLEVENRDLKGQLQQRNSEIVILRQRVDRMEMKEKNNEIIITSAEIDSMDPKCFANLMVGLISSKLKVAPDALHKLSFRKVGQKGKQKALVTGCECGLMSQLFALAKTVRPTGQ